MNNKKVFSNTCNIINLIHPYIYSILKNRIECLPIKMYAFNNKSIRSIRKKIQNNSNRYIRNIKIL